MSGIKRRNHSASFKSKVALEALRGQLTIAEISSKYGVSQSVVTRWKQEALSGLPELFERGHASSRTSGLSEQEKQTYQAKIGELIVERDFLLKAYKL
jgi:transposase